jgi:hypothetical protein
LIWLENTSHHRGGGAGSSSSSSSSSSITAKKLLDKSNDFYYFLKADGCKLPARPLLDEWIEIFAQRHNVTINDEHSGSDVIKIERDLLCPELSHSSSQQQQQHHQRLNHSTKSTNEILNCQYCQERYDEPKILPCGNTICIRCVNAHLLDKEHMSSEFNCFMCSELHDFPKNKLFPTNQALYKLLQQEQQEQQHHHQTIPLTKDTRKSLEKLRIQLKQAHKQRDLFEEYMHRGDQHIRAHCQLIKQSIEQAVASAIDIVNKTRADLIVQLDKYERDTCVFYAANRHKPAEKEEENNNNFKQIYAEIEQLAQVNSSKYEAENACELAADLNRRLDLTKRELEMMLFNGCLVEFTANGVQVGFFVYDNHDHIDDDEILVVNGGEKVNKSIISFEALTKIDFNLNKLIEKKTPFQFRSDVCLQVLDSGSYACTYRDSSDKLYYLAVFSSDLKTLIKNICLPLQQQQSTESVTNTTTTNTPRLFKHKSKLLIGHSSSNWCNRLITIDTTSSSFAITSKDFEQQQDDQILWITASDRYIFCLLASSNIACHCWSDLTLVSSFTPSLDESLPFCIPTKHLSTSAAAAAAIKRIHHH